MRAKHHVTALGVVTVLTIAAAGCGTDAPTAADTPTDPSSAPPSTASTTARGSTVPPATTATTAAGGRGWIGGEPSWTGSSGHADDAIAFAEEPAAEEPASGSDAAVADHRTLSAPSPGEPPASELVTEPGDGLSLLRAGSVDDNDHYDDYLAYLTRISELGIPLRPFDPAGRIVVAVTGANGRPVSGVPVAVSRDGADVASIVTTADGTIRFLPAVYGQPTDGAFSFRIGDSVVDAVAGSSVALVAAEPGGADVVALDVLFVLDATGSMGDEIDRLKQSIASVAARVDALEGTSDVRFGMTLYRDEGDLFVTSTYDFTDDVVAFQAALSDVMADGGGDYPEALDEALAEALAAPAWRGAGAAIQLVFLVADAPPQIGRQVDTPYTESIRSAVERGIKLFPIASSESDDQAEAVFRQLAQATGAPFVFLSYGASGAGGAATGTNTDIDATDYEELALDDLVVRLIAEEVADLIGDGEIVPPPSPTTTTVPDGQ